MAGRDPPRDVWEHVTASEREVIRSKMLSLVFGGKWAKLPRPFIVYDLDVGLSIDRGPSAGMSGPDPEAVAEYFSCTLTALQTAVKKDTWIYVCDEEAGQTWRFRRSAPPLNSAG